MDFTTSATTIEFATTKETEDKKPSAGRLFLRCRCVLPVHIAL